MCNTKLGHAHLKVRDLDRAIGFYSKYLGLRLVERVGDQYAFLSGDERHHEIALQNAGADAPMASPRATGLYHVAFEVPNRAAFADAYRNLVANGVDVATVDHRISWALYFSDPDGNGLEIYWDTRCELGGQRLWRGRNLSLRADKIVASCEANGETA